jgi:RND family efflux transporter MFP subunit
MAMKRSCIAGLAFAIALGVTGCNKAASDGASGPASGAASGGGAEAARRASGAASGAGGPPVSVSTVRAQQRDVDVTLDVTGTVAALNSVDVRPQVSSIISKVHIREGQFVKAGQLLFTLDSRNEEGQVAKARSQLVKDQAALADAQRQLARSRDLLAQKFISQGAVDTTQTLVDTQQAVVVGDTSAIKTAEIALSYTRITAPSAGRAGAISVYAGSTVQPGATSLVTITQLDPIAVAFNLPQRNLADALRTLRSGGGKVTAVLPEGRGTAIGKLQFVDNAVDANSGTVKVKATFDNPTETLWPGAFVSVQLAVQTLKDAVVVPQASVIQGPRGAIVYTVGPENKAVSKRVDVLYANGPDAVASGVTAGDRVVLDGRQNVRPGSTLIERAPGGGGGRPGRPGGAASGASGAGGGGSGGGARAASGAGPAP